MYTKNRQIAIILNTLIIIFELIGITLSINLLSWELFTYYTVLSNMLLLISSITYLCYELKNKENKKIELLKYSATVSVTLTFLVVVFVLSWTEEGGVTHLLFDGLFLYLHTICPIIAIISFVFFEKFNLGATDVIKSVYFTVIYSIIMIILNILGIVDGPYPFLRIYNQPILTSILWLITLLSLTLLIAAVLRKLNDKYGSNVIY